MGEDSDTFLGKQAKIEAAIKEQKAAKEIEQEEARLKIYQRYTHESPDSDYNILNTRRIKEIDTTEGITYPVDIKGSVLVIMRHNNKESGQIKWTISEVTINNKPDSFIEEYSRFFDPQDSSFILVGGDGMSEVSETLYHNLQKGLQTKGFLGDELDNDGLGNFERTVTLFPDYVSVLRRKPDTTIVDKPAKRFFPIRFPDIDHNDPTGVLNSLAQPKSQQLKDR